MDKGLIVFMVTEDRKYDDAFTLEEIESVWAATPNLKERISWEFFVWCPEQ